MVRSAFDVHSRQTNVALLSIDFGAILMMLKPSRRASRLPVTSLPATTFLAATWLAALLLAVAMPSSATAQLQRVDRDLQLLYSFDEGQGNLVRDQAGKGWDLDLTIDDPSKLRWARGHLVLQNSAVLRSRSSAAAGKLTAMLQQAKGLTLEAWIKPANLQQKGPARIVSLSHDTSSRNFTLGQEADTVEVRLRTSKTSTNGIPAVASPGRSLTTGLTHIVYTRGEQGTATLFLNGKPVVRKPVAGELSNWDASYPLLIGNEATGDRPWLGELHLVALYSRGLSAEEVQRNFDAGHDDRAELARRLPPPLDRKIDFVADVQPLLRKHCFECHAKGNEEGGLNLAIQARVREGGEHGPALVPGDSLASSLIHLVAGVDEDRRMPPEGEPLSAQQVGLLRAWIDQGAVWPRGADVLDPQLERAREHWAFQRLKPPHDPPQQADDRWSQTPVDRFVSAKLRANQLTPTSPLPPRALARRLYFDLVGLPPKPHEVAAFVVACDKDREAAVEELVDRLLASRHYGERWARHWLDVARYADSDGQEADRDRPHAYHYRDFVIRAFNDDMPFRQFVRWQLAGDELEPENAQAIAATGFLVAGPHTVLPDTFLEEERLRNRYNELDDVVSTVGTSLLGLTLGCARCHDHKYDAISSRDYYRLLSVFHSGDRKSGKLPGGEQGYFFADFGSQPRTSWLFRRGDFQDRELQVKLGFPGILSGQRTADEYWKQARTEAGEMESTLQRRALAEWITDVEQGGGALLARVIVNRIWQHHFGQGLVRTESDFGVRGDPPTHPELLEWLTADFVANGWRIKRLHRLILGSATWQQATTYDKDKSERDPENRLLWRRSPRRLEAEILRDAMLAISDSLNLAPYGPGFKPPIPAEAVLARNLKDGGYPQDAKDTPETRRRSVYMFHKRVVPYPLFQVFDRPDLLQSCGRRQNTTVAPQALALLNDAFVRARAEDFARLLKEQCKGDLARIAQRSFELALGRVPNATEQAAAKEFLTSQTASRQARKEADADLQAITDYCQSLFGLNEFIYVD